MSSPYVPMLAAGLALALFGAPMLLLVVKLSGGNSLGLPCRLSLWVMAGLVLVIARAAPDHADLLLGWLAPGGRTALASVAAVVTTLAAWPVVGHLQGRAGGKAAFDSAAFREIFAQPIVYRLFLIATAAITEEILYRGFAIGVGAEVLGSRPAAVALSLIAFVGAHFRWGLAHMVSVLWAAVVLTTVFVVTDDLWACIAAHGAIDLIGLVLAPAVLARRSQAERHAHIHNLP